MPARSARPRDSGWDNAPSLIEAVSSASSSRRNPAGLRDWAKLDRIFFGNEGLRAPCACLAAAEEGGETARAAAALLLDLLDFIVSFPISKQVILPQNIIYIIYIT
jgi:hypothetical protein